MDAFQRCTRCTVPITWETVHFDEEGVCNICRNWDVKQHEVDWSARDAQLRGIFDEVRAKVSKNCELQPVSTEGREGLRWVLVDYGCVVIHVFTPEMRDFYRLERLWGDAPRVELDLEGAMAPEAFAAAADSSDEDDAAGAQAEE